MSALSPNDWRNELRRWLRPSYLWRRLRHNILPKLAALVVAMALWFITTADRRANVEQGFDVPITVRDTTGGNERRAVSNLNPDSLRVTLAGRPERLRELRGTNIEAVVDVTGLPEGGFNRPVTITVPTNTTLVRKTPERIQGFVDIQLSRTLPIQVAVATPPENSLPRYTITPTEATVSGASRVITNVSRLVLSPISLAPGDEREVRLLALNSQGSPIENIDIKPVSVTLRRLDSGDVPVKALRVVLNTPPKTLQTTSVSVQPSTVRVVAAPDLLSRLREVSGTITYREGTYTTPVKLRLPAGAQALEEVNVRLTVEKAKAP